MSHICYLFEGLTFSLWFGVFAPCRSGIDFTMPQKVAVRRIAIGRCVANCRKYALSPRPRGRFSPVGNENRGHPTTASYLCIGKSSPERQGVAGKEFRTPCGAAFGTKKRQAIYDHRRYLCPEAVSAARPLTLKLLRQFGFQWTEPLPATSRCKRRYAPTDSYPCNTCTAQVAKGASRPCLHQQVPGCGSVPQSSEDKGKE